MAWTGESEVAPTASPSLPVMTPLSGFAGQGRVDAQQGRRRNGTF
jgi:hypothetical protein